MPNIALIAVNTVLQTELVSKHNCVVNVLNESYKVDIDTILYVDKNHINSENIELLSAIRYVFYLLSSILVFYFVSIFLL